MKKIVPFLLPFLLAVNAFCMQATLNQSTAVYVRVGPVYYDPAASSLVADTTSTVSSWTCRLTKGIGTASQSTATVTLTASGGSNDCVHDGEGLWKLELTATDTNTVGGLEIAISYAGRLPCVNYYDVVAANGYADHYTGTTGLINAVAGYTDTVEGTLSTIAGYTDTVEGSLTTIAGYTDQVEGYTDSVEGTLATIAGYTDQVEGYTDTVETSLATIAGYTDTVESLVTTVDAVADNIYAKVDTEVADILTDTSTTLDDYLDTEIAAILAAVDTEVATIVTNTNTIIGYTDTVEGSLTTIAGYTDAVEGYTDTVEASLTTIAGYVDILPQDANAYGTTAVIADAVWDEVLSGHTTAGTGSKVLTDAYTNTNTIAGYTDTVEASLTTIAGYTDTVETSLTTIAGYTDTVESLVTTVDTVADNIYAKVDTEVADILTDTGTTLDTKLNTIAGYTDTEVAAILAAVDTEVANILTDTGTTLDDKLDSILAGGVTATLSAEDRRRIAVAGDVIPASGMTLPKFEFTRVGNQEQKTLIARGLSYSAAEPSVLLRLVDGGGNEVTYAMEDSFTHTAFAMQGPDITGATPYAHLFKWTIPDSLPDGWYQLYTVVEKDSSAVGTVNTLILDPTTTVESSSIASQASLSGLISAASESFRALRSGHPADFTMYRTLDSLQRATAGVSSAVSRSATTSAIYGAHVRYYDPFSKEYVDSNWLYDYDETYGASGRAKAFDIPSSVTAAAIIDGVTLTTAGDLN